VNATTTPGSICRIRYPTPAGKASQARGLGNKVADASETVLWSWNIGPSTAPGTGTVTVECDGNAKTVPIGIR
jgi:hypothetical protein